MNPEEALRGARAGLLIRPASDRSLLVRFALEPGRESQRRVAALTRALLPVRGILNLHPAYASLLVDFDPRLLTREAVEALIRVRAQAFAGEEEPPARRIEIPVRFGGEDGPDLEEVARHAGLRPEEAVKRFLSVEYAVAFVGFATCFPYLMGLPAELATPRLPAPRRCVPAGSVAIAGRQVGVYPLPSPGGWRWIGHTDLPLFDSTAEPPGFLRMGDQVRFVLA
jgi:KipI family sensor histidine kinase inhibitor